MQVVERQAAGNAVLGRDDAWLEHIAVEMHVYRTVANGCAQARRQLSRTQIYGGCLCSCNGRGSHLFSMPNHDADLIQNRLGPFGLAGFFCNGEIGPVGDRNYLHGYTASLALLVRKAPDGE